MARSSLGTCLPTLGVNPELGRGFTADEEKQGTRVVLISHALWVDQFGADPSVLGRSIKLSGDSFTVIGVMPASFRFPVTAPQNGVWTTLAVDDDPADPHPMTKSRGAHFLSTIGRMKPGVTVAQVDQDLEEHCGQPGEAIPQLQCPSRLSYRADGVGCPYWRYANGARRGAGGGCFGSIDCLRQHSQSAAGAYARTATRDRGARGAGRGPQTDYPPTAGGKPCPEYDWRSGGMRSGLCLPRRQCWHSSATAFHGLPTPEWTCGYSASRSLLSFLAGLIFGIVPAITASKTDLVCTFKEGGRTETSHRDWLRSSLIVAQVALGLVLTAGAGLLITSFMNLLHTPEGFNPDHLLTFFFELPDAQYKQKRPEFYRDYFEKVRVTSGRAIRRRRHDSAHDG